MTMGAPDEDLTLRAILAELDAARASFHGLLDTLSAEDLGRPSLNPGWTNGEIVAHMVFGFIVVRALLPMTRAWGRLPEGASQPFARLLNALTAPFNWFNALGARMQGRVFTHARVGGIFDSVHRSLVRSAMTIHADEWQRGMSFPGRWDPNFGEFMTLEMLLLYPVRHLNFHLGQLDLPRLIQDTGDRTEPIDRP